MEKDRRKSSQAKKKARRRGVFSLVLMALCFYFIYTAVSVRFTISRERQTLEILERRIYEQKLVNEELERIVYSDGEKEYIERLAREKLGYAAIDERIFVDLAGS